MTLKGQIAEFVTKRGCVTVAEICREFEAARGELWWKSRNFEGVVFWQGMSQEAIEALEEKAIFMRPCSVQEHQGPPPDGFALLLLPLAMSGRSYASAHWRVVKLSWSP
jgi:hypothetical protein